MPGPLSDPLRLPCGQVLPNRLIKAAMTEGLGDPLLRIVRQHVRIAPVLEMQQRAHAQQEVLGVDVDEGSADPGQPAVATGWLERDVVTPSELDATIAAVGQVAHRGAGTFHRLVAIDGEGLARAHRRW